MAEQEKINDHWAEVEEEQKAEWREQLLEDIVSDLLAVDRKLISYHQVGGDARWLRQHFDPLISKAEVELLGDDGDAAHQREESGRDG